MVQSSSFSHPLDQQHADEVVLLARFVNRDSRKAGQQDLINGLMIQDLVGGQCQAVFDLGHNLADSLVIE